MPKRLKLNCAGQLEPPTLVLATKSAKKIGAITNFEDCKVSKYLNSADEISFTVYKYDGDDVNPLWESITDFKSVWYAEADEWFEIQVNLNDSDSVKKSITGVALCESELSQVNLDGVEINTEDDIARDDYKNPTVFYNKEDSSASLLDRVLDKVPNYSVDYVSESLKNIQRKFSFDRKSIYDCLKDIAEEVECLFVFGDDSDENGNVRRTVSAYDLKEYCQDCGKRFDAGDTCPDCGGTNIIHGYGSDTGIVVSRENLSDNITYAVSKDDVKNCFRLVAGDDLMTAAVRTCNPNGSNYIWRITDDMKRDMSDELVKRLDSYTSIYNEYQTNHVFSVDADKYNALVQKYIGENKDLRYIRSGSYSPAGDSDIILNNYPAVIEAYYCAYDMGSYLQTVMMPTVKTSVTNVETELKKIQDNLSVASIPGLSAYTSVDTMETAVKSVAKLLINTGKFSVKVNTAAWNNPVWTGTITITNWGDDTDTGTTGTMTVTASNDATDYIDQMIASKLNDVKDKDLDIVSLFNKDDDAFKKELTRYNLTSLKQFYETCQTCVDILIEQGCGDPGHYMYSSTYIPWRNKQSFLEAEVDVRSAEVAVITGDDGILKELDKIQEEVSTALNFEKYIGPELWNEFLAYRRESDYSNDNYISDGLTNSELIQNAKEFIAAAESELYKSAELQHTITASLYDLLLMPEFEGLTDQFAVGNWLYVIVDETPYRLRMTEYDINFDDVDMIDVKFSDVVKTADGLSDVKSVIDSAASMSSTYNAVMHQANMGDAANRQINDWVQEGLNATNTRIVSNAVNQEMAFDSHGITGKRYEDITEQYSPRQCKLTNTTLAFTDDNWATARAALGMIVGENGEQAYGLIADNVIGKLVAGERLVIQSAATDDSGSALFQVDGSGVKIKVKDPDSNTYFDLGSEVNGLRIKVAGIDESVSTQIEQLANSLTLSAGSIEGGKVAISLKAGDSTTSAAIDVSGLVSFTDLATSGKTTINGANITTGSINAARVTTGIIQDKNGKNYWNLDTGAFSLSADTTVGGSTVSEIATGAANTAADSALSTAKGYADGKLSEAKDYASSAASSAASAAMAEYDSILNQQKVFQKLTGGQTQGIYLTDGRLYINGSYIKTGVLDAGSITMSGRLFTRNGGSDENSGYIGYMEGSTGTAVTKGIGISNRAGDCFAIATEAGVRLQAWEYSMFVTKTGTAAIRAGAGTLSIETEGPMGPGLYYSGSIFAKNSQGAWYQVT